MKAANLIPQDQQRQVGFLKLLSVQDGNITYGKFKAPGLQWQEKDAITVRQLLNEQQMKRKNLRRDM